MSNIEWTSETWNPIVGCSIKSPGCKNCYAMPMAARLEAMGVPAYEGLTEPSKTGPVWNGKLAFSESALLKPLKRKKPQTYFVNSMGDLFHEDAPDEWIDRVFAVMALCPQHTFQVLTKRSERMREYMNYRDPDNIMAPSALQRVQDKAYRIAATLNGAWDEQAGMAARDQVLDSLKRISVDGTNAGFKNVWLGVSVEDQKRADERIPDLLATPAAVRWISAEPLLGPLLLNRKVYDESHYEDWLAGEAWDDVNGTLNQEIWSCDEGRSLDWVVVGGESGKDARSFNPDWARSIRDQCQEAGVAYFMKQMGGAVKSRLPDIPDDLMIRKFPCVGETA